MYGKKYGHESEGGYGDEKGHHGEKHGGYIKKSYIPVPYTINVSASMCRHECIPDIHDMYINERSAHKARYKAHHCTCTYTKVV